MKKSSSSSSLSSVRSIFMHADGVDKWLMTLGFFGAVGDGLGTPAMLLLTANIFNKFGTAGSDPMAVFNENINRLTVKLLYLACGYWVSCFLEAYCWSRTAELQSSRMRARYLKAVLRQDIAYFDLQPDNTSQVVTSVSSDSLVIQEVLSEKVPNFVMNASTFIGSYITAFILMWRLTLVSFPSIILLIIPGLMYGRILMGLARKVRDEYDKAGTIVEQAVSSVRTVYSFVGERRTVDEFSRALEGSVRLGLKQGMAKGIALGSNSISFSIWAFMCWYGSRLVMYHGDQGGTVFAAGASVIMGGLSLGSGLSTVKYFSEAASAGERIEKVMERVPGIDSGNLDGEVLEDVMGEVEFRGVEFAYPSRPEIQIFQSFDLRVSAGKTVALVGESGSGKSTVIALLQRFYDPSGGEVLVDGVDIRRLQIKWLRAQMGLVSQEPALFATSIKENIVFGKEDATMEEVMTAAKAANAHNFICQLPHGYDTQVGERGVQMSGGQKQRIAIARAVIKSPKILLLDEATSALDSESERIVQEALDLAAVGRTTIVIAHRLSTIRNADTIAVVNGGRVVEIGSHQDLISNPDGPYASLIRLQDKTGTGKSSKLDGSNGAGPEPSAVLVGGRSRSRHGSSRSMSRRLSSMNISRSGSFNSFHRITVEEEAEKDAEGGELGEETKVPSFRRLLAMNLPEWWNAVFGCLGAILFGTIQPLYAYALGSTISVYFLTDHDEIKSQIRIYSLLFLALTFLSFLINVCQHYNFAAMGENLTKRIRERMLTKILTFEVAWFDEDENSTGAVCSRLSKDATIVRSLVGDRMALLIQATSAVLIACTMGLVIAWKLAIVMIVVQPLIIVCFYLRRVLLRNMSSKAIKAQADSSKLAVEAVSNIRTVTAFSSQDRILNLFDRCQDGPRRESIRQSWYAGLGLGTAQSLMMCTWALDFWYGGKLISKGEISAKAVFQTFMILVSTGRVIADAGSMTTDLAKGAEAVASVFDVLDRNSTIEPEDLEGHRPEKIRGDIEFREVNFAYPSRPTVPIFQSFSLSIEAGKSTALVGQSGSGKSTVIGLIERFYDPLKGTVRIDRKDIRSYNLRALRRHIALVGQEPTLFSGSIRDNIAYGAKDDVTVAEIEEAARAANAHDFISVLKEGYNTWCGDRGVQLSGGQKQRIAIARAILKNPSILLLDEATSALDSQSESVVQEALDRVMVGRTSVVVAHRLSTVRNCDVIAVLDKGNVVEKGSHESLMAKGLSGAYYSLVSLQHQQQQHS